MASGFARNAIILGLLSVIGPFAIDMYLPALPSIAADLDATIGATQLSLTSFFIAFGLCQLLYGLATDMLGRKAPLYFGLTVFGIASVGCALAPTIGWLIAFRFLQGIGASATMVIPRAIIRDLATGVDATRLMSMIMLVFSVSPILAPLVGSVLIEAFDWRAVFVAVTIASLMSFVMLAVFLKETLPPAERVRPSVASVASGYGKLLRDGNFLGLTFIGGFGMSSFFAFLASSSFVYMDHFGLTPMQYAMAFAVNAISFIGASQFSASLGMRFGLARVIGAAVTGYCVIALALLAVTLAGVDSLAVLAGMLFLAFGCLGLVVPATMVLALDAHGPIAGMASALGGTLQFLAGSVMIVLVSVFFDGTALPMVATIAGCSVAALILARLTLPRVPSPEPVPAE